MRLMLAVSLFYGMHFVVPVATEGADLPTFPAPTREQARDWYEAAKEAFQKDSRNSTSAWKFAEACFEWAEFASHSSQRALLAHEGIAAAKLAVEREPESAAAHFYLAMNKGQLARTKTLGALPLVREMERSFQRAIALEPKFDNAAADRSLGMLYLDAPGWPTSIGNKSKARKHLERAVELCPEYPTNHLALMNAYLRWEDEGALHTAMERYRKLISAAKETYAGKRWENSWKNWDEEWKTIIEKSQDLFE
jgi:tetratricopeptide (TPR) repeat protein